MATKTRIGTERLIYRKLEVGETFAGTFAAMRRVGDDSAVLIFDESTPDGGTVGLWADAALSRLAGQLSPGNRVEVTRRVDAEGARPGTYEHCYDAYLVD